MGRVTIVQRSCKEEGGTKNSVVSWPTFAGSEELKSKPLRAGVSLLDEESFFLEVKAGFYLTLKYTP